MGQDKLPSSLEDCLEPCYTSDPLLPDKIPAIRVNYAMTPLEALNQPPRTPQNPKTTVEYQENQGSYFSKA